MKRYFLLSFCLWAFAQSALAYPISPQPLRMLVAESKFIIVGHVVKIFKDKEKKNSYGFTIARIAVIECLQGKLAQDTIELMFNPHMTCPASDMYYDSTDVICFLDVDEKGRLHAPALSYGSKTLSLEEIAIYKARVREIQEISAYPDKEKRFTETVDWLVRCAEQPCTRWEGTFELSPESDFMSFYSNHKTEDFSHFLSTEQKQRLYKSLLSGDRIGYTDFALVDLVYKGNEAQIDALLLKNLRSLEEDNYWMADEYMKRLRYKSLTADMRKTMLSFEELRFENDQKVQMKAIINDFIRLVE